MDKEHYKTALLLAAGAALGQILCILIDVSFSIWGFLPMILLVFLLGALSLRSIARNKGLVTAGVRTRVATGVWIFLVWELLNRRIIWLVDMFKVALLFVVLFSLAAILERRWEE
jgi:hypothetical protein